MADALCRRFASDPAQETLGSAIARGARVLGFTRVFVLSGSVVSAAVVAYLHVRGAGASGDVVAEAVATGTLDERLWVDGDLHGDALVVHVCWFGEELTECRAGGVVDHDVDGTSRRLRVGGRVRRPSWAVVEG